MATGTRGKQSTNEEIGNKVQPYVYEDMITKFEENFEQVISFFESKLSDIYFTHNLCEKTFQIFGPKTNVLSALKAVEYIASDEFTQIVSENIEDKKITWSFTERNSGFMIEHLKNDMQDLKSAKCNIKSQNPVVITCDKKNKVQVKLQVLWLCWGIQCHNNQTEKSPGNSDSTQVMTGKSQGNNDSTQDMHDKKSISQKNQTGKSPGENDSTQDMRDKESVSQKNQTGKSPGDSDSTQHMCDKESVSQKNQTGKSPGDTDSTQDMCDKKSLSQKNQTGKSPGDTDSTQDMQDQNSLNQKNQTGNSCATQGSASVKGSNKTPPFPSTSVHPVQSESIARTKPTQTFSDFKLDFTSNEGLLIRLYSANITSLKVDSIVNAANDKLDHIGGVAWAIAHEAGHELEQQCRQIIAIKKQINVTENCVTKGWRLPCRHVIHAVGPQWSAYRNKADCLNDLYKTVQKILQTAEKEKFRTVAMPAISSGIYGVPHDACAMMYIKATMDFSRQQKLMHVKELHFVDMGDEILFLIAGAHDGWITDPHSCRPSVVAAKYNDSATNNQQQDEMLPPSVICRHLTSKKMYGTTVEIFEICQISVKIYTGDLVKVKDVDAIVSSQDPGLNNRGKLSQEIYQAIGMGEKTSKKNYPYGEIVRTTAGKLLSRGYILHAVVRRMSTTPTDTELLDMKYIVRNILNHSSTTITRIAMPLLGTGSLKIAGNLESCCKAVYNAIGEFVASKKQCYLSELQLVNKNVEATKALIHVFKKMSTLGQQRDVPKEPQNRGPIVIQVIKSNQENIEQNFEDAFEKIQMDDAIQSDCSVEAARNSQEGSESQLCLCDSSKCSNDGQVSEMIVLGCGHTFCTNCAVPLQEKKICTLCQDIGNRKHPESNHTSCSVVSDPGTVNRGNGLTGSCVICIDTLNDPVRIKRCGHVFCRECIMNASEHKPICPVCNMVYGKVSGNQPNDGTMTVMKDGVSLPGYPKCRTLIIDYNFPSGTQKVDHPHPGVPYKGIKRTAFLPDNVEGKSVLDMLIEAFRQRLTFTIGISRTTGKDDTITWNDIHHKTSRDGGPQRFGYPDPSYLLRVKEELNAKGIKETDTV